MRWRKVKEIKALVKRALKKNLLPPGVFAERDGARTLVKAVVKDGREETCVEVLSFSSQGLITIHDLDIAEAICDWIEESG